MAGRIITRCIGTLALLGCGLAPLPMSAQTLEYLDALSDATVDEATGIATAREQAESGQHLEALATLERVLALFPKSAEARLIHAIYLCDIDDKQGGLVEIDQFKKSEFGEELIEDARARCSGGAEEEG
jgi:hypothetical protein